MCIRDSYIAGQDKAIITPIKGTTRDILEAKIKINNMPITLYDTAGYRNTTNKIEVLGIQKSLNLLQDVDVVLIVDQKSPLDIKTELRDKKYISDNKNIILEIRAGTGGDEAALFAADLFRLYSHFSEKYNWEKELIASSEIGIGGFKEVIISLKGNGAYGMLKYESGVHRVQRVPETETGGRVHTSAATVAVLPEAEEIDLEINDSDLKIDTYRASGAGGQHVNKTESAIRITHIPSGLVVTCQDESSQHKNRAAALKVLRSRLLADQKEKAAAERAAERKSLVSTGDRSAKIRTYNFPQGRVTDHRINFTSYRLSEIMNGDIEEIIEKLKIAEQQDILSAEIN